MGMKKIKFGGLNPPYMSHIFSDKISYC